MRLLASVCLVFFLLSCKAYEYEEEVFFDVDGTGSIRISGTHELLGAIHGAGDSKSMRELFEDSPLEIDSVRETSRGNRSYVHIQGRFNDWNQLCHHPVFHDRSCSLVSNGDQNWVLTLSVPALGRSMPSDIAPDESLAFRFHFPSRVSYHNSPNGIERGNIIRWERSASEYFDGVDLLVEARFERRSVLATTVGVLGTAAGIVVLGIVIAIAWMVRKGRHQIAEDG